jgi:hypothetical protein
MSEVKITRRELVQGAAVAAAAAALPVVSSVAPAMALPAFQFPLATPSWVPLDAKAAARLGWEIHAGKHPGQSS